MIPTLPKFDGEDPARPLAPWLQNLEVMGEIHGWTPLEMVSAAKQCLKGSAEVSALGQYNIRTWEEFQEEIEEEFGETVSVAEAVIAMQKRKKKGSETTREYMQAMRNLGGQVGMAEKDVIRFIAEGLTNDESTEVGGQLLTTEGEDSVAGGVPWKQARVLVRQEVQ